MRIVVGVWLSVWISITSWPAAAAPLGTTVAGVSRGVVHVDMSYGASSARLDAVETLEGNLGSVVKFSGSTLALALGLEPIRFVGLEGRVLAHKRSVDQLDDSLAWGWGYGATLRVTPVHAAGNLLHLGLFGAYDREQIGAPGSGNQALVFNQLRAGLGVGLGSGDRGYIVDIGVHYSRAWGSTAFSVTTRDEDTTEEVTTDYSYDLSSRVPVGVKIGAGLFSGPLAPAHNTRSQLMFGIEGRLIDEWALSMRVSLVL